MSTGSVRDELHGSRMLLALLAIAVCLNYTDRSTLAVAAPLILHELQLTATQMGMLMSAFYVGYLPMQVPSGWLAERFGPTRVLAAGVAVWSVATGLMSLASSFAALCAFRVLLGVGESAYFPSSSKLIVAEVPRGGRATANAIIAFGLALGPAIGAGVGGKLMGAFGWRTAFAVFGCASLLWLIPWSRVRASAGARKFAPQAQSPPWAELTGQRALWGASLGHLSLNYTFSFMLAWLPLYLVKARGFSMAQMAGIAGTAYLVNALASVASGRATDGWVRRGVPPNRIYKLIMTSNHLGAMLVTVGAATGGPVTAIACLWFYQALSGMAGPGVYAIGQTLAGPHAAGRWIGIQNTVANLGGLASPVITGVIVDRSGTFVAAFVLAASMNVLGLIGWLLLIRRIEPIAWSTAARAVEPRSNA